MLGLLALAATVALSSGAADFPHMNQGIDYTVSNPAPGSEGRAMKFHGKSFFTVDSPKFKSRYSQVVWHTLQPVSLPEDIVKEYDGKVMSVTGWEVDVLRDADGKAEPVPCYESYNHHYGASLQGKGADLTVIEPSDDEPIQHTHGGPKHVWTNNEHASGDFPTVQDFAEHNGNEARQTLHYMAGGYGIPIESPQKFVFTPMQINTRNPDGTGRRCGEPGTNCPLPSHQNAPPGSKWSGILECPCNAGGNTRMIKTFDHRLDAAACTYNSTVTLENECFEAARVSKAPKVTKNVSVADRALPYGCSVSADGSTVTYNSESSNTSCAAGGGQCICRSATGWINGKRFDAGCMGEPLSDLLKTHNPTCDLNMYDGGLGCCGGTDPNSKDRYLLDADTPIPPLEDEVYFRWRFYYEDYTPKLKDTYHVEWQFGRIEYSVPIAPVGTAPEDAIHTLTTRFQVKDLHHSHSQCYGAQGCKDWDSNRERPIELLMMGFHCHSPSCLGGQIWNADTGEMLCHVKSVAGNSTAVKHEENYLWLPPCQWGSAEEGLLPPPKLKHNTNFTSIKWANNTVAHSGVMAIWQGRAAYAD